MKPDQLRQEVFEANLRLPESNLIILTWGNVSGFDRESGLLAIKPSGVQYSEMKVDDIVICDLDGNIVEGKMKPSSDLLTHIELYRNFDGIAGICHTHSRYASAWAQALRDIPAIGTTHADYFYGNIPCTRILSAEEVDSDYERNTGRVICETFTGIDPLSVPAVLVASHGPFTWGESAARAVENSLVLEEIAQMAAISFSLGDIKNMDRYLLDKHYLRKHGKDSYYGQKQ
ncbi:MAG: L-ribulose-5-phosphate 4-epimerase [Marinilabiliaceae bacterium]|jgi:L-ribulose-5-phosphate 4-epimerase|nr:L-ribulose-5-phosphate 4-epimerase [Marinilabiliaceae bacterium]